MCAFVKLALFVSVKISSVQQEEMSKPLPLAHRLCTCNLLVGDACLKKVFYVCKILSFLHYLDTKTEDLRMKHIHVLVMSAQPIADECHRK